MMTMMTMIDVLSHFCGHGRLNGPSDPKGNEAKPKTKQPSDMPSDFSAA